jgi:hypothetical protein
MISEPAELILGNLLCRPKGVAGIIDGKEFYFDSVKMKMAFNSNFLLSLIHCSAFVATLRSYAKHKKTHF